MATKKKDTAASMTPEEIESEIAKLKDDEFVKLDRMYYRYINRRLMLLYQLRTYRKNGMALSAKGITADNLRDDETNDDI